MPCLWKSFSVKRHRSISNFSKQPRRMHRGMLTSRPTFIPLHDIATHKGCVCFHHEPMLFTFSDNPMMELRVEGSIITPFPDPKAGRPSMLRVDPVAGLVCNNVTFEPSYLALLA
jgi:hypothetical protein